MPITVNTLLAYRIAQNVGRENIGEFGDCPLIHQSFPIQIC